MSTAQTTTTTARDEFFDYFQEAANKELLKFAAGHAIFCPTCHKILDCKTTVHISVMLGTSCVKSITTCECCWLKQEPAVRRAADQHAATLDIVRWPGRKPRTPRTKKSAPVADPRQERLIFQPQEETV
jgi:hypothetical protein